MNRFHRTVEFCAFILRLPASEGFFVFRLRLVSQSPNPLHASRLDILKDHWSMKIKHLLLLIAAGWFPFTQSMLAQFADAVADYRPGTGVIAAFAHPASALGEPSRFTPGTFGGPVDVFDAAFLSNQVVSMGPGGSLTLEFRNPIRSDASHPFGIDFILFGNAGFVITNGDYSGGGITDGSLYGENSGGSRVSVSTDGITFYVLNPSLTPTVDTWFPTDGSGNFFLPVNPLLKPADVSGRNLSQISSLYAGSGGGAGFSLSWAQDQGGVGVAIDSARFIRVEPVGGRMEVDAVAAVDATVQEMGQDFTSDPMAQGWSIFGDPGLFRWNQARQNLEVIWDSSRPNSYFQWPLGTLLTRSDDFSVALDLELNDIIGGFNPSKPAPMQLAFGFQNRSEAESPGFNRPTSSDSPDLVEFNFFPDTGFGPTVWPAVYSTNSAMNYNGSGDFSLFDLPVGVPMHIVLNFASSNQTLTTMITTNGVLAGPITTARLATQSSSFGGPFTQFQVDTFAISSYTDQGVAAGPYASSILAHGAVDNILVTVPPPPIRHLSHSWSEGQWVEAFISRTNWNYVLQATTNLSTWSNVGTLQPGNGGRMLMQDTPSGAIPSRFYRIQATHSER